MPVGATLTALRRERGKTVADVVSATKIMERMILALENERWDDLPAQVYVRGYIQNYADFLGVDYAPLLAEYGRDIGPRREHVPLRRIPEETVVPHRLDVHDIPKQAWVIAAVAIVAIALVAWGIAALLGRRDTPPPIAPETTSTPDATTGETGGGSIVAAPEGGFVLTVEVVQGQSSWLQIRIDDLIAYEGTLPGGEAKSWSVADAAVVRIGKPSAVTVSRDGMPVEIPPATDGIAQVSLTAGTQ
ncbi:MAG: helix-turn-helix domain-containing protein [Actinobacteria bacterium]|nr:helix-turn-helix domain-containing protein [Actinomycetota bacterium]